MSDKALSAAQKAFVSDVKAWRKASGLSLRELSRKTMINVETLAEFERTGHFSNPVFNRVYLRSLAGSYARCVALDVSAMHEALDQTLNNDYDGALGRRLRGVELEVPRESESKPDSEPKPAGASVSESAPGPAHDETPAQVQEPRKEDAEPRAPETPKGRPHRGVRNPLRRYGSYRRSLGIGIRPRMVGIAIVALLVVIVVILFVLSLGQGSENPVGALQPMVPAVTAEEAAALPSKTLPDSFYVIVHAAYGKVEGIDVEADGAFRFRCWIELDAAKAFVATDSLELGSQLNRIRLFVDGYEIPIDTLRVPFILRRSFLESADLLAAVPPASIDTVDRATISC